MKYFIDTEFHEYSKQPKVLDINIGKSIDTIELISIGIVNEDIYGLKADIFNNTKETSKTEEYYAICKDFDIKAAWNNEWLRENVLKSIWKDLVNIQYEIETKDFSSTDKCNARNIYKGIIEAKKLFTLKIFKHYINKYGKTREQIAGEILEFINAGTKIAAPFDNNTFEAGSGIKYTKPEFYAYYADYDWVVFCWLFGRMIDLPKGFPMYCNDLKQELDKQYPNKTYQVIDETLTRNIKDHPKYPKQSNEHNALADAKWNKELYNFLNNL